MGPDGFTASTMVDIVLAVTVVEALALGVYHRLTGKGIPGFDLSLTLLSGGLLLLALRMHMAGHPWEITASLLAGGGICHALDLRRRWQPGGRQRRGVSRPS